MSEPLEGELLCDRNDQCVLLYEHTGRCEFRGNIPRIHQPVQTWMHEGLTVVATVLAAGMNAGVGEMTINLNNGRVNGRFPTTGGQEIG